MNMEDEQEAFVSLTLDTIYTIAEQTENGLSPSKSKHSVPNTLALCGSVTPPGFKSSDVSPQDANYDKKKRIRRRNKGGWKHHKKWKPYTKLSWDERKVLEEKEGEKAARKREKRLASGQPMAPNNTTSFIMDLHDPDPIYESTSNDAPASRSRSTSVSGHRHDGSGSMESSDEYYSSPDDEEIFAEREFSVDYENYHAEHIRSLSKDQLVKEVIELERKCEILETEKRIDSSSSEKEKSDVSILSTELYERISFLRTENEQLRKEIEQLRLVNAQLKSETENKENNPEI